MRVSRRVPCTRTRAHLSTACTQVFLGAIETMHTERAQDFAKEGGGLEFDKDDPQALDLVTSASNLRSQVFHIPRKSRWEVKEIAGKIVPAIATTNAIIGGFIVLEALKVRACRARARAGPCTCTLHSMHVHVQVLRGETAKCRYMVCNYHTLTGRKRDRLLDSTALDVPNPKCGVCLPSMCLVVDTTAFTVGDLIDAVVTKRLGFSRRAARAPHRAAHRAPRRAPRRIRARPTIATPRRRAARPAQADHLLGDPGGGRGRPLPGRPDLRGARSRGRRGGGQVRPPPPPPLPTPSLLCAVGGVRAPGAVGRRRRPRPHG